MIMHRQVALGVLTLVFLAGAVYCFAGYSMATSFSVADPEAGQARLAARYGIGVGVALLGAVLAGVAAWRADRR
jgi:hypothetical protein